MSEQQHEHQIVFTPPSGGLHPIVWAVMFLVGSFGSGAVVHQVAIPSMEQRIGQCEIAVAKHDAEIDGHDRRLDRIESRVYARAQTRLATGGKPGR